MFFLKVFSKFIGIILVIVGILTLVSFIVAFFSIGIFDATTINGMEYVNAVNTANVPVWVVSLLAFIIAGVPFFFLFYLGLKILVTNLKSIGNIAKFTLLGLWLTALIATAVLFIRTGSEFAIEGTVAHTDALIVKPQDTLRIKMVKQARRSQI